MSSGRRAKRYVVGLADEVPVGKRKIVDVEGKSIGIFNVGGSYYGLLNRCPHQGAPLCLGTITGTALPSQVGEYVWAREGEILRCPWHGWEVDITNGRSIFNPHRVRVRTYEVAIEQTGQDPQVETFPVDVDQGRLVLYVR